MEIFWTGLGSLVKGDVALRGFSYLWMFPIYGLAIGLEPVHDRIRHLPWYIRGIIWTAFIFGIEFVTGGLISLTVGKIPWDYSGATRCSMAGLIRTDYAPVWFGVGLLFEQVDDFLRKKVYFKK